MDRIKEYLKKLYKIMTSNEMRILPGNIAFFMVLSLMPILTLVGIVFSKLPAAVVNMKEMLVSFLPVSIVNLLSNFFASDIKTGHLAIILIIGFVVASNGAHAIILASNTLYKTKSSNYIVRRFKAFLLIIILMLMFIFALSVLAFGNTILKFILSLPLFDYINFDIYSLFVLLKYPTAFIVIYSLVKAIYTMAPDKKIPSRFVTKGALFTTIGWIIVTLLYAFYATNIANYNRFYGSLSNIAMLMIWIYLISYVFVLGISINTSFYELSDDKENNNKENG